MQGVPQLGAMQPGASVCLHMMHRMVDPDVAEVAKH